MSSTWWQYWSEELPLGCGSSCGGSGGSCGGSQLGEVEAGGEGGGQGLQVAVHLAGRGSDII